MRVVLDANIVVAVLLRPEGWIARQWSRGDATFLAPQHLRDELMEHADDLARRAGCTMAQWNRAADRLLGRVQWVPREAVAAMLDAAEVQLVAKVDSDDVPYAAAFLAAGADYLWTLDKALWKAFPGRALAVLPGTLPDPRGSTNLDV